MLSHVGPVVDVGDRFVIPVLAAAAGAFGSTALLRLLAPRLLVALPGALTPLAFWPGGSAGPSEAGLDCSSAWASQLMSPARYWTFSLTTSRRAFCEPSGTISLTSSVCTFSISSASLSVSSRASSVFLPRGM
jgi:hypothetical protein